MEETKNNSNLKVIIITVIITLLVAAAVVYFVFLRKPSEPINTTTNNKLYHIETGEKFTIYGKTPGVDGGLTKRDIEISFDYPVIDIDNDKVKEINKKIYDTYQDDYNTNLRSEFDAEACCVAIKKDDKYYGITHIFYDKYKVFENDDYLSIVIISDTYTECADAGATYKGYVVNKKTKEVMTNTEIAKMFNASEASIIAEYNKNS